jgi:hypothetical protein
MGEPRLVWRPLVALAVLLASLVPGGVARANGAFPDSFRVFVPDERAGEVLLATNFGLISSEDGGQRWEWTCEHDDGLFASIYELGPGPAPRLYAVVPRGLALSDDGGCTWSRSPELEGAQVLDLFADQSAAGRLWIVAQKRLEGGLDTAAVYLSTDGGRSFGAPRYRADPDANIQGVESARSDPSRVYLTVRHAGMDLRVEVVRSNDGGETWITLDVTAGAHKRPLLIAGVDPVDPDRVYFRLLDFPDDSLALSTDGGETLTVPLTIAKGTLTAFVRRADGSVLVGSLESGNLGGIYRAAAGTTTFTRTPATIRTRRLAERAGVLYAATDNTGAGDGFALATSTDGATWQPLARYDDVVAIKACSAAVVATCAALCPAQVANGVFKAALCPPSDAGPDAAAAPLVKDDGGGCRLGGGAPSGALVAAVVSVALAAALAATLTRRRRARTPRPGGAPPGE